jgi:3-dehydroquinate dehydratase-1
MTHARQIEVRGRVLGQGSLPLVCIPLVGATAETLLEDVSAVVAQGPDVIEWRADFLRTLDDMPAVLELLGRLADRTGDIPLLFTIRSQREGGQPVGLDEEAIAALGAAACRSGRLGLIDTELSAPEGSRSRIREAARATGTQLVLSYHNFAETPDAGTLYGKLVQAQEQGADIGKVAVMPRSPADVLVLLEATLRAREALDIPLISMSMGPLGALTRVVGWVFGSSLTFAAGRGRSAPGQLEVADVKAALEILRRAMR